MVIYSQSVAHGLATVALLSAAVTLPSSSNAFVVPLRTPTTSSLAAFNLFGDRFDRENEVRRKLEFKDLGPIEESETRRERLQRDTEIQAQFETFGDSLWDLRSEVESLSHTLIDAIHGGEETKEQMTRERLRQAEQRDPELAYKMAIADVTLASQKGESTEEAEAKAAAARSCLPQFNLDGLWVGKYGTEYHLINITYAGDTLIAEKVTGEGNVPKGEISFQADLHPLHPVTLKQAAEDDLQPIALTEKAAQKWGTRKLPRYSGLGQVAEEEFTNNQWLDGQLIIIGNEYFSFAWLPIEQQIFFGRPSPELALKMLRDAGVSRVSQEFETPPSLTADLDVQKDFAVRCLELTHDHEDEVDGGNKAFGGLWQCDEEDGECHFE